MKQHVFCCFFHRFNGFLCGVLLRQFQCIHRKRKWCFPGFTKICLQLQCISIISISSDLFIQTFALFLFYKYTVYVYLRPFLKEQNPLGEPNNELSTRIDVLTFTFVRTKGSFSAQNGLTRQKQNNDLLAEFYFKKVLDDLFMCVIKCV